MNGVRVRHGADVGQVLGLKLKMGLKLKLCLGLDMGFRSDLWLEVRDVLEVGLFKG